MRRPPERGAELFSTSSWAALGLVGVAVGLAAIGSFMTGRALDDEAAQTMAFATIAIAELILVFAIRSPLRPFWAEPRNPLLLGGVALSAGLLFAAVYAPPLRMAFGTVALDAVEVGLVIAFAVIPFVVVELAKAILRRAAPSWAMAASRR
jgi:magnesium-transporting ATPase (P-type)